MPQLSGSNARTLLPYLTCGSNRLRGQILDPVRISPK